MSKKISPENLAIIAELRSAVAKQGRSSGPAEKPAMVSAFKERRRRKKGPVIVSANCN